MDDKEVTVLSSVAEDAAGIARWLGSLTAALALLAALGGALWLAVSGVRWLWTHALGI